MKMKRKEKRTNMKSKETKRNGLRYDRVTTTRPIIPKVDVTHYIRILDLQVKKKKKAKRPGIFHFSRA